MPRIYTFLAVIIALLLIASSANPPNGFTGAPSESLCTSCHSLGAGMQDGTLVVTGFPATVEANVTYPLTITNSNPNGLAALGGFQMTILNSSNQKAGDFLAGTNDPNSAIQTFGGRQYWEHDPAQNYPMSNSVSWTVSWKAPSGPVGTTITYYAAGNVANGNGQSTGDLILDIEDGSPLEGGADPVDVEITSSTNVSCNGGNDGSATATASMGTPPYTYSWSNGGSGATVNNLTAGTYTVTVSDNGGSTATASVSITQPPAIVFLAPVITHVSCFGGSDGSIQVNVSGGIGPYTYDWSNGDTGSSNTNIPAGSYTVTVTDNNDCTKTATYVVNQPAELDINLVTLNHESCMGENDGSITISVTGGVAPYFAEWSNGFIGLTISNLEPDTYSVTVTDNNDCTSTATYVVNPGSDIEVNLQNIQHVTCNGGNNGSITVAATGGEAPYNYAWSNGGSGPTITNLMAGNYLVTVTDNNGCNVVSLFTVNQPPPINVPINATGQNLCAGDNNVTLTAAPTGANPPFTGMWSNGVQGLSNPNLPAGTYTVTVTDSDGCTGTGSATVTAPALLTVSVSTTDETSSNANDGTATASPAGGTPAYTYLWSNGQTTPTITGLAPGTYTVTITDMNGCTAVGTGQVDEFGCTLDITLGSDLNICEDDTILIVPAIVGATGTTTFLWSDGSTGPTLEISTGGEYCLTVTDMAGCQDADCIIITEDDFPEINCPVNNESVPGLNDGSIVCDGVPGIVTYLWSNGATTPSITGLAPGEYCVTMTNIAGCVGVQCFIVQPGNCQLVITPIIVHVECNGDGSGSISLSVTNATDPVTYLWSNGATSAVNPNLAAGDYTVTITDAAGCGEIITYTITEPAALTITIDSIANVSDFGLGLIHITVTGGTPPYTIIWTDPFNNLIPAEDLNNLTLPGYYSVNVADGNNCEIALDSILVGNEVAVWPVLKHSNVKVYPVPTQDILYLELEGEIKEAWIMGLDGRVNKHIHAPDGNRLDVSGLEAGWYLVRVTDGERWFVARMVK